MEQQQYNGKCYTLYDSFSAVGRIGYPTAQNYCVSKSTGGNYGELATFATWADFEAVTSLFVNYPNSGNGRAVFIGLQNANTANPTWEDPNAACGVQQFTIGSGPPSCGGSWTYNPGSASSVTAWHSWCDWEAAPTSNGGGCCRWVLCEFGMQDLSIY